MGGGETYGKFIAKSFLELIERRIGKICINLGYVNAGVDVFATDRQVARMALGADVTVLQLIGAYNVSNQFYTVHPRRNDRFLKPSTLLQAIYRDVDFAEFNFNKHNLHRLFTLSLGRFDTVVSELQQAWLARMRLLLSKIDGKVVLLWFEDHTPDDVSPPEDGKDPWFVTRGMIQELRPIVTDLVEVTASPSSCALGTAGMVFSPMDAPVAQQLLRPVAHQEVAVELLESLKKLIK